MNCASLPSLNPDRPRTPLFSRADETHREIRYGVPPFLFFFLYCPPFFSPWPRDGREKHVVYMCLFSQKRTSSPFPGATMAIERGREVARLISTLFFFSGVKTAPRTFSPSFFFLCKTDLRKRMRQKGLGVPLPFSPSSVPHRPALFLSFFF